MQHSGLGGSIEGPSELSPRHKKLREHLSRFSGEIRVELLDLYDTWLEMRSRRLTRSNVMMTSHIGRELLEALCKYESDDEGEIWAEAKVDSEIEEFEVREGLVGRFEVDRSARVMCWRGLMEEDDRNNLLTLSDKQDFRYCVWELYKKCARSGEGGAGVWQRKLRCLLKRLDPLSSGVRNTDRIEAEYSSLRRYFAGLAHFKRSGNLNERTYQDNFLRAEQIIEIIAADQASVFDSIDGLGP